MSLLLPRLNQFRKIISTRSFVLQTAGISSYLTVGPPARFSKQTSSAHLQIRRTTSPRTHLPGSLYSEDQRKPSGSRHQSSTMSALKAGDQFPDGVTFSYVPYSAESESITACGIPQNYNASKEWADKKVVLFAVPGAFTPGCSVRHLPGYIENLDKIKEKAVDVVAVIAFNDAFVMSAWSKANGIKNDDILFMSDPETKFSKSIGWTRGERTSRYAMVIDHGKIVYAENEPGREVTVSGALAVLAKL